MFVSREKFVTFDGFVDVFDCVRVKGSSRSFWFCHWSAFCLSERERERKDIERILSEKNQEKKYYYYK